MLGIMLAARGLPALREDQRNPISDSEQSHMLSA